MISRRGMLAALIAVLAIPPRTASAGAEPSKALADLEHRHGGRLGVALLDGARAPILHRGDERFAMCSTFKVLLAGFVLWRIERGRESLERRIVYGRDVLLPYAPTTSRHVGGDGMSVSALCEAAVTLSDNTAANLLLVDSGGPRALTAWLRASGDGVTRLDHNEPALNDVAPGQDHDTTTPLAMALTLRRLLFGEVLGEASRARLAGWMVACQTGLMQLRAGVPKDWTVGDKTGSFRTTFNDVAALWPPEGPPRLVTAYYVGGDGTDADRKAVLAEVGRIAVQL